MNPWDIIGWALLILTALYVVVYYAIPLVVRLWFKFEGSRIPPLVGQVWVLESGQHLEIETVSDTGVGFKCFLPHSRSSSFSYTHRSHKDWRIIQLLHTVRLLSGPRKANAPQKQGSASL